MLSQHLQPFATPARLPRLTAIGECHELFATPAGMTRRHFMQHLAGASALAVAGHVASPTRLRANAAELKKQHKAAILLWMSGGPPRSTSGTSSPALRPAARSSRSPPRGDVQICEHMPLMAKQMNHLSIVRSMSTREADHNRGRYYMHTGYVPNPNIEHPSYGSVVAHELADQQAPNLEIPPFVSVGGGSVGPGLPGHDLRPVRRQLQRQRPQPGDGHRRRTRLTQRMQMLDVAREELRQPEPRRLRPTTTPRFWTRPSP